MKHFLLVIPALLLFACHSNRNLLSITQPVHSMQEQQKEAYKIVEKWEIIPQQKITIQKEESGSDYIKLLPGDNTVFKYSYTAKPLDPSLRDANYTQYVYFQMDGPIKNMELKDLDLSKVQLTAQIYGFRNTAVFSIYKGRLQLQVKDGKQLILDIDIDPTYTLLRKRKIHQSLTIK